VGWEEVACTKAAISLKRVKIEETLLWSAYRHTIRSFERYRPWPPTRLRPPLPQDWGSQHPAKTSIPIISRTGKATDLNLAGDFTVSIPLKILEKRERGRI